MILKHFNPMQDWAIGVDLGATKIEVALINFQGFIKDRLRIPTEIHEGYNSVINRIASSIDKLRGQNPGIASSAIGVGVAGQVEKNTGLVSYAPNLEWHRVNIQEALSEKVNIPIVVCNDVRAATWGEWLYGAGKGCNHLVCVFVGTGIGGGIVSSGQMLEGFNNTAGEIGHITLDINGAQCHCGNRGCFEALASGWAIERDARMAVKEDRNAGKKLLEISGGETVNITAKAVADAALQSDPLSKLLINNITTALIAGSISIVNTLGPHRLIFGGGVIEGIPGLIGKIEKGVKKYALGTAASRLEVLPASLHEDSVVVGAAVFALKKFKI